MSDHERVLSRALARWEHLGRPGLPDAGFVLERRPGHDRRGVYATDGEAVFEPEEHVLLMAPAPDRLHVAVQLAARADEKAVLAVVEVATGRVSRYPEVRCRYEPMLWSDDSRAVELVARDPARIVSIDVHNNFVTSEAVVDGARLRLFPGGTRGVLAESRTGERTRLIDRASGRVLGSFAAVVRVLSLGDEVVAHVGRGIHVIDPATGTELWSWHDPELTITAVTTTPDAVHLAGVRAGSSRLIRLERGVVTYELPVRHDGGDAVATDLADDGSGQVQVVVEGPTLPPRVIDARDLVTSTPEVPTSTQTAAIAQTKTITLAADDSAELTVSVTSPLGCDGPAAMILTCYGGFGVANLATFEPTVPVWTHMGGRYATAHVRGGGEHGAAWRDAGRGQHKWRAIEDLACVARALIDAELTRPDLLTLVGSSHGGMLVTSCALGHPHLCSGVVTIAAPLDLLRLEDHPLGTVWAQEFGDTSTPEGLERVRAISPLHRAQTFPAGVLPPRLLGVVLEEDSRVDAGATMHVAAALRAAGGQAHVWHAPATGHGSNHLSSLHRLGVTVLGFAASAPGLPTPRPQGARRR